MNENARYRLQRKETYVKANILGNRSFPVYTYRWKDIAVSNDRGALEAILQGTTDQDRFEGGRFPIVDIFIFNQDPG